MYVCMYVCMYSFIHSFILSLSFTFQNSGGQTADLQLMEISNISDKLDRFFQAGLIGLMVCERSYGFQSRKFVWP